MVCVDRIIVNKIKFYIVEMWEVWVFLRYSKVNRFCEGFRREGIRVSLKVNRFSL